jgi:hypothetical protein
MTDEKKIKQLLRAFYNGDTTQDEEALLREFFNDENLSEKWYVDRNLFHALYDSSDIHMPEGLSERLEGKVDRYIKETDITNEKKYRTVNFHRKIKRLFISIGSIAAAILFLTGIFFFYDKSSTENDVVADTFTNPQEAAIAAEKVLVLVSSKLNKGLSLLEKAKESMDKTNELLNESFNLNR